jgi:hypothetical protein
MFRLLNGSKSLIGNSINMNIDVAFVKFALESILEIKRYKKHKIKHIIDELIKRQLKYHDYYDRIKIITISVIMKDPYFFLIHYSYMICDYQYIQITLKSALEKAQKDYIELLKKKKADEAKLGFETSSNIGINLNTSIKIEYLYYIKYYGFPKDRIFLPSILERIKYGIINNDNYIIFNPYDDNLSHLLLDELTDSSDSKSGSTTPCSTNSNISTPKSIECKSEPDLDCESDSSSDSDCVPCKTVIEINDNITINQNTIYEQIEIKYEYILDIDANEININMNDLFLSRQYINNTANIVINIDKLYLLLAKYVKIYSIVNSITTLNAYSTLNKSNNSIGNKLLAIISTKMYGNANYGNTFSNALSISSIAKDNQSPYSLIANGIDNVIRTNALDIYNLYILSSTITNNLFDFRNNIIVIPLIVNGNVIDSDNAIFNPDNYGGSSIINNAYSIKLLLKIHSTKN